MNNIYFKKDRGIALIAVLGILLLLTLLTLSIVTVSKICSLRTAGNTINERSMLLAEGVANRVYWIILNERKTFKTRQLGTVDYETGDRLRLMADGVKHQISYYSCHAEFTIYDMQAGIQINGQKPGQKLKQQLNQPFIEESKKDKLQIFYNRLLDYVDSNSLIRLNSLEADNYSERGLAPLPRNRSMEFREEILYVPGSRAFFPIDKIGRLSSVTLIAPRGLRQVNVSKPNIFSSSVATIATMANLSSSESELVVTAIEDWVKQQIPLNESLDAQMLSRLKQNFSFTESGYYTIIIRASENPEFSGAPLVISVKITNRMLPSGRNFYEWTFY